MNRSQAEKLLKTEVNSVTSQWHAQTYRIIALMNLFNLTGLHFTRNWLNMLSCVISQNKDGGFLVRDSSKAGKYTVSLFSKGGGWVCGSVVLNTAARWTICILCPLAPVMSERIKRRTVCNESGNRGPQRERDVNYSCKTWTYLPAKLFHCRALRLYCIMVKWEDITYSCIHDKFLCQTCWLNLL